METIRVRVNGEMLQYFKGHTVCILGKLKKINNNNSFVMETCDGKIITVKVQMLMDDQTINIIEVHGDVNDQGEVICCSYSVLNEAVFDNFDMELYNETIKISLESKVFIQAKL